MKFAYLIGSRKRVHAFEKHCGGSFRLSCFSYSRFIRVDRYCCCGRAFWRRAFWRRAFRGSALSEFSFEVQLRAAPKFAAGFDSTLLFVCLRTFVIFDTIITDNFRLVGGIFQQHVQNDAFIRGAGEMRRRRRRAAFPAPSHWLRRIAPYLGPSWLPR